MPTVGCYERRDEFPLPRTGEAGAFWADGEGGQSIFSSV